jgi:hypothetical protein
VVAGTTGEFADLASARSANVGPSIYCGGGHDKGERYLSLCSHSRHGLSQPLWWRAQQVMALRWTLFAWSALGQAATVMAGTTVECAILAAVCFVGVGAPSEFGGRYES